MKYKHLFHLLKDKNAKYYFKTYKFVFNTLIFLMSSFFKLYRVNTAKHCN